METLVKKYQTKLSTRRTWFKEFWEIFQILGVEFYKTRLLLNGLKFYLKKNHLFIEQPS